MIAGDQAYANFLQSGACRRPIGGNCVGNCRRIDTANRLAAISSNTEADSDNTISLSW